MIGPDLRLHGSKLNLKSPQYGSPVEWHQDWAFYPHTNDDILAIGVMLDDMRAGERPADGDAGDPHGTDLRSSRGTAISPAPMDPTAIERISSARWR